MLKVILQFVTSGSIVVLATWLSHRLGQKWAGLLVAAPLLTLITYMFLSIETKNADALREYLLSALVYMVPAAAFIGSLLLISRQFSTTVAIAASLIVYTIIVVVVSSIIRT